MKYLLPIISLLAFAQNGYAQSFTIESTAYDWEKIDTKSMASGEIKTLFEGNSDGFEYLHIFIAGINGGDSFEFPDNSDTLERLVIMKSGNVTQTLAQQNKQLGKGSVTLVMPGDLLQIQNAGIEEATFYVVMWRAKNISQTNEGVNSFMIEWNDLAFEETEKGGRRKVTRKPTVMLDEFEMHVTTLNEGMRSHPPHTHLDEEIILVCYGEVEELIDGKPYEVGEGSLIFLRSMVPHGIRNIGKGSCEYYAFRWIPKKP
ncbi:cupin domain-containing protein [Reichenbachiella sp. MALMAid0571]|uniref:cupin domain-containing protein n=1 Tax=Reichenbachiella sp. MALMAid0571 TaxID=3143939 RepID=UPI0032E03583